MHAPSFRVKKRGSIQLVINPQFKKPTCLRYSKTPEFLTSSTVGGTSVRFLPTQAVVSVMLSQLQALGHFLASTGKDSVKTKRTTSAEKICICASNTC